MEIINWIPRLRILCWIFWGKEIIYKIKYSGSLPHPDFLGVTISSHVIYCRFLPIFRHLWTTQENQNRLIRSRRICCNWGENFRLSQKENVLDPEKVLILLITCELVSATMSIALFSWSQRFIYFLFFILLQFCYWNEANLPRLCQQEHLQLHFIIVEVTQNILVYELDLLYIFDFSLWDMQIYLIFDLISVNDKYVPWDRNQIGIKLGTDFIPKVSNC